VAREWAADVFRTSKAVEQALDVHCVLLPLITPKAEHSGKLWRRTDLKPIEEFVNDAPYSRFTESLRNVKALIDASDHVTGARVIGVVSSLASEGKTTIAANLAALTTASGARTLIVDADLHLRLLTATLAPDAAEGLIEALEDPSRLGVLVSKRQRTRVDVLPCVLSERLPNAADLLGSTKMERLLAAARESYDYIIIEIPPIMSVVDVKMIERFVDNFVFIVEWGKTKKSVAMDALLEVRDLRERLACAILNKVNLAKLRDNNGKGYSKYYEG
jgi:succinoglycan biosynthesis transport protein ExoP